MYKSFTQKLYCFDALKSWVVKHWFILSIISRKVVDLLLIIMFTILKYPKEFPFFFFTIAENLSTPKRYCFHIYALPKNSFLRWAISSIVFSELLPVIYLLNGQYSFPRAGSLSLFSTNFLKQLWNKKDYNYTGCFISCDAEKALKRK